VLELKQLKQIKLDDIPNIDQLLLETKSELEFGYKLLNKLNPNSN